MKICKFYKNTNNYIGAYSDEFIYPINKNYINLDIFSGIEIYKGRPLAFNELQIKSPLPSNKIVYGIADNYKKDVKPIIFFKGESNSATPMLKKVNLNLSSNFENLWAEPELGFVLSKDIKIETKINNIENYIFGYFLANDITGSLKGQDHHLICSKSSNGFLQTGSYINLNFKPENQDISLIQDGVKLREDNIKYRNYSDAKILENISKYFPLKRGDSILTGAPKRCRDRLYLNTKNLLELNIKDLEYIKYELEIQKI